MFDTLRIKSITYAHCSYEKGNEYLHKNMLFFCDKCNITINIKKTFQHNRLMSVLKFFQMHKFVILFI